MAAAVGGATPPSRAEDVTTRGGEIVAREAPGTSEAGIAVLRGNARVRLLGEQDGWSEILLPDGRRAWVPAAEIVHIPDPAPSSPALPAVAAAATAPPPEPAPNLQASLAAEITRLRSVVDALEAERRQAPRPMGGEPPPISEVAPLVTGTIGLVVGTLLGGAWTRYRARRRRSIRF
ncbi:MAG: hypothetical protein B6D46_06745 [Polyangiaceae bacterium UTPRO1]|nr:SH3 domain-containing protein [Myxococcales bacterium]OQY67724.1 MAG: hypothetical protein B6D46_06745 [Polyangiaceae bacterium UTPRO1]